MEMNERISRHEAPPYDALRSVGEHPDSRVFLRVRMPLFHRGAPAIPALLA
jgi:hypothetical protein